MFSEYDVDRAEYMAFVHAIAQHTVGLSILNGHNIGTGTLLEWDGKHYILTALHNLEGTKPTDLRFFLTPTGNAEEGSMASHASRLTALSSGKQLPVDDAYLSDAANDLAAIPLAQGYELPAGASFYVPTLEPMQITPGASLALVGYAASNSVAISGNRRAIGMITEHVRFDPEMQHQADLPSSYDPERHLLTQYTRAADGIEPYGISGTGLWCNRTVQQVWSPRPGLVAVQVGWFEKKQLLKSVKIQVAYDMIRKG
jgi:hypothetical protein